MRFIKIKSSDRFVGKMIGISPFLQNYSLVPFSKISLNPWIWTDVSYGTLWFDPFFPLSRNCIGTLFKSKFLPFFISLLNIIIILFFLKIHYGSMFLQYLEFLMKWIQIRLKIQRITKKIRSIFMIFNHLWRRLGLSGRKDINKQSDKNLFQNTILTISK